MKKPLGYKSFLVLALILVVVGCNKVTYVLPINMEEARPSFTHTLKVFNETQDTITLIPPEESDALLLEIAPGQSKKIKFVVIRVAEIGQGSAVEDASSTSMVADSEGYVGMENNEGLLQVEVSPDVVWDYLISLRDCWSNDPQSNQSNVTVDEEPDFTTNLRLCEQI